MSKIDITWQKGKGKVEDCIVVSDKAARKGSASIGPFVIPARIFHDMSRAGIALLRENHYGTFLEPDEISLEIKKARPEYGEQFLIDIYVNDNLVMQLWCDHISKWSESDYSFSMKGQNICGIGATKVKIAEELKGFASWKPKK